MTQQDVYDLLKKEKRWMTSKQIAEQLKVNHSNISRNLKKLFEHGAILKKENKRRESTKPYQWMIE